jgi:hypothetical protein
MRPGFSRAIKAGNSALDLPIALPEPGIYEVRAVGVKLADARLARWSEAKSGVQRLTCRPGLHFAPSGPGLELLQKTILLNGIKVILAVQPPCQKYSASGLAQISGLSPPSRSQGGAARDRHGRRERDAVDADVLKTNSTEADGEVVWS